MDNTHYDYKSWAEDMLTDALDSIGHSPELYGADNYAIDSIRNNQAFHKYVEKKLEEDGAEEYQDNILTVDRAGIYIWRLYEEFAWGHGG